MSRITPTRANVRFANIGYTSEKEYPIVTEVRPLSVIAAEVLRLWTSPANYAAKPYLRAMLSLRTVSDNYGADSGEFIVLYALSNMQTWRGDDARRIKKELKAHLPAKYR